MHLSPSILDKEMAFDDQVPYASIRENNWALFFDFKGYIGARYDL